MSSTAPYVDDVLVHPEVSKQLHLTQDALGVREVVEHVGDLLDGHFAAPELQSSHGCNRLVRPNALVIWWCYRVGEMEPTVSSAEHTMP